MALLDFASVRPLDPDRFLSFPLGREGIIADLPALGSNSTSIFERVSFTSYLFELLAIVIPLYVCVCVSWGRFGPYLFHDPSVETDRGLTHFFLQKLFSIGNELSYLNKFSIFCFSPRENYENQEQTERLTILSALVYSSITPSDIKYN